MRRVDLFRKVGNLIKTTKFVFILFLCKVELKQYCRLVGLLKEGFNLVSFLIK
jgi:hypothetical protein